MMSLTDSRATRVLGSASGSKTDSRTARKFEVGELVLVSHGEALKKGRIWPGFQSLLYGTCQIVAASHLRYELVPSTGKSTKKAVQRGG